MKYLQHLITFTGIVIRRLREQGLWMTLQWLYGVGVPYLTGDLPLRYSRITPQLYLGAQHGKRGIQRLEAEGVSAVVNMRDESDDAENDLLLTDYCYIPVIDNTAPTILDLERGVEFIRKVIDAGEKVYVHCHSGVGRAPTMVAAYLVAEGYALDEAVAHITEQRPFIRILPDQMARLREYEAAQEQLDAAMSSA